MKEKDNALLHENLTMIKISKNQKRYIDESTYDIVTPGGLNYRRTFEILSHNLQSGKVLLKEKLSFGNDNYEKVYVLSSEGKTEKYRGDL